MPMFRARLAGKQNQLLGAIALVVYVCDQLQTFHIQAAQPEIGDFDAKRFFFTHDHSSASQLLASCILRCQHFASFHFSSSARGRSQIPTRGSKLQSSPAGAPCIRSHPDSIRACTSASGRTQLDASMPSALQAPHAAAIVKACSGGLPLATEAINPAIAQSPAPVVLTTSTLKHGAISSRPPHS